RWSATGWSRVRDGPPPARCAGKRQARRELQEWVDLTRAEYASLCLQEGRLLGHRLTVCRLDAGLLMQEIRDIRTAIASDTHEMSQEERSVWFADRAKAALASLGYELHPHPDRPRASRVVKKQES
ncbi:MAG: hypothetical protein AB1758_36270, partial [Candidatus Eremiobacterota bacterium]